MRQTNRKVIKLARAIKRLITKERPRRVIKKQPGELSNGKGLS